MTKATKRLGVSEARSKLSEVLRERASPEPGGAAFLKRVEALKQRHGGGVSDFEPAPEARVRHLIGSLESDIPDLAETIVLTCLNL